MIKEGVYLISRDLSVSKIELRFPCKKEMHRTLCDTLLDGILVEDRDKDEVVPRYLAFDIVTIEVEILFPTVAVEFNNHVGKTHLEKFLGSSSAVSSKRSDWSTKTR